MLSYLGVWSLGLFSPTFFSTSSKKKKKSSQAMGCDRESEGGTRFSPLIMYLAMQALPPLLGYHGNNE